MSAVAVLTAAAECLTRLAQAAQAHLETDSYWKPYDPATAWRDGFVNGFGTVSSDLVAVLPPAVALELARWLAAEARQEAYSLAEFGHRSASPHAVALAEQIVRAAS